VNRALVFAGAFVLYLVRFGFLKATQCIELLSGRTTMTFYLERFLQFGTAWFLLWVSAAGQSGGVAPLQALLEPERSEYVLGVPVKFTASIRNVSSAPVLTYSLDDSSPLTEDISFFISEDGSPFHGFRGPQWYAGDLMDMGQGMITLKPGEKEQAAFSLLWNGPFYTQGRPPTGGFAFPHAGTYLVKVRVSSKFGDLMSNVVRVVIRQPQGDDAAIWEALKADKGLAQYYDYPDGAVASQGEKTSAATKQVSKLFPRGFHEEGVGRVC
jgi:hypothetical protein